MISWDVHAVWLVLATTLETFHNLLEDRLLGDVIFSNVLLFLSYKTNRFNVAVGLFSERLQTTSKCGKNVSDTLGCAWCALFFALTTLDVICDPLLRRGTATSGLFVK